MALMPRIKHPLADAVSVIVANIGVSAGMVMFLPTARAVKSFCMTESAEVTGFLFIWNCGFQGSGWAYASCNWAEITYRSELEDICLESNSEGFVLICFLSLLKLSFIDQSGMLENCFRARQLSLISTTVLVLFSLSMLDYWACWLWQPQYCLPFRLPLLSTSLM